MTTTKKNGDTIEKKIRKAFAEKFVINTFGFPTAEELVEWFVSFAQTIIAETRKEERLRIEKEIVGRMPMFGTKKTRETVKVFLDIIKPVFSLSSEQEET
jgi:hypothetical protein